MGYCGGGGWAYLDGVLLKAMAVAAALVAGATAPASASLRPVDEGGDVRHCATYAETRAVQLGGPLRRAERVLDMRGVRLGPHRFPNAHMPHTALRRMAVCQDPGVGNATVVIQYRTDAPRRLVIGISYIKN